MRDDEEAFAAEALLTISECLTQFFFYIVISSSKSYFLAPTFLHFYGGKLSKARNLIS
jgi:hypothetical protein